MRRNKSISLLLFIFVTITAFTMFSIIVEARKQHSKKTKPNKHRKDSPTIPGPAPAPLPQRGSCPSQSSIFNILSFGAKGDGGSDDSKVRNGWVHSFTFLFFSNSCHYKKSKNKIMKLTLYQENAITIFSLRYVVCQIIISWNIEPNRPFSLHGKQPVKSLELQWKSQQNSSSLSSP